MSDPIFNGRFTPQNSAQISADEFDVQATFFDGLGLYSAADIRVGDIVFLDCFSSMSAPGTVNRYRITQVNLINGMQINCRIKWNDTGLVVDPGEVTGTDGFISRATQNKGLPYHSAPTIHTIPDYVVQYSRNSDLQNIIDPFMSKLVKNESGVAFPAYSVLCWLDNGSVALAEADILSKSDIAGINVNPIANGEWGWIVKTGYVPGALVGLNAIPGKHVFLSEEAGRMTLIPPPSESVVLVKIGRAEPPSGVVSGSADDLHMEIEFLSEP